MQITVILANQDIFFKLSYQKWNTYYENLFNQLGSENKLQNKKSVVQQQQNNKYCVVNGCITLSQPLRDVIDLSGARAETVVYPGNTSSLLFAQNSFTILTLQIEHIFKPHLRHFDIRNWNLALVHSKYTADTHSCDETLSFVILSIDPTSNCL